MKNRFNSWSAIAAEQEKTMWRNLEKTKTPKKQNFLEKFWFQVRRLFFLVFLEFFCFFWFRFLKPNETSRKPKNQKTKTFWRSFGFRSKDGFFWFSLSFFGFFWFRFLKTKKNLGFFWFFEGNLSWSKAKNKKKLKVFLVFWSDV